MLLHSYIRTISSLSHYFLFWYCKPGGFRSSLSPVSCLFLYLFSFSSQTVPLETSSTLVSMPQAPTPLRPSGLLAPTSGQPSTPTCSQVPLLCLSGCRALLCLSMGPAVWLEGPLTTPRAYFSSGSLGSLSRFVGPMLNFVSFFEPDVSG